MPPRSDDTPRRGVQPRRGTSRDLPPETGTGDDDDAGRGRGFGGIGDARAYTPRGRTMAERDQRTRSPRAGRTTDPFRPALQVLDGGAPPRRARAGTADDADESEMSDKGRRGSGTAPRTRRPEPADEPDVIEHPARTRGDTARPGKGARGEGAAKPGRGEGTKLGRGDGGAKLGRGEGTKLGRGQGATKPGRGEGATKPGRGEGAAKLGRGEGAARLGRGEGAKLGRGEGATKRGAVKAGKPGRLADSPRGRSAGGSGRPVRGAAGSRTGGRVSRAVRAVAPEPPKLANSTRRLRIGAVVALALFVMIGVRLVVLQVASSPEDAARLLELREDRLAEVKLPAARGSILDRDGAVLAHSVEARFVAADPVLVRDPVRTAAILSPLIGVKQSSLVPKMIPQKRPGGGQVRFEYLAQGVPISIGEQIAAMKLPGIVVKQDERRYQPGADLAANLIGFTGADNSGLEGLEARYDSLLRGTDGVRVFEIGKGDLNKPIPGGYSKYTAPQQGTSIKLTIDDDLQYEVQRILREQAQKWKATMAGAVVLDVKTGEVLAQASYPTYNAAKWQDYQPTDREDVPSSIVADPGSVHKAFMFGAALEEGIIKPDSVQVIGPALERGGYIFQDSHRMPKGTKMTMPGLLALSSNVGTILISDKLGPQRVYEYQQKFGLGKATGEGTLGEASGRLLTPDEWSGSASGSVPIGMSVDATLIQMAAGYGAIANNGTYVQPHLIQSMISGRDGKVTPGPAPETHQVLRPEVAAELRTMMEAVVDKTGATGTQAAVTGYRVAGKTGTGKRLIDGQYTSNNYGSFIGMAPAENPRFVVAVSADVPHGTGGDVAAPAFSKMMQFALLHYRVPPSSSKPPTFKIHP
nr:penicillin-binding transpeptidase domain-containing protein [uncultured Actinoplanes sp.]